MKNQDCGLKLILSPYTTSCFCGLFLKDLYVRMLFYFQLAKCVLWHNQQRKLPINKTREAINKKGVRVQKEEMKCSLDGEK